MNLRYGALLAVVLGTACTFTPNSNGLNAGFNPPLVYKVWEMEHDTLPSGTGVCSLSSGYDGVTVVLSEQGDVAVRSNRFMKPGAVLTIHANGGSFQSAGEFFPQGAARSIAARFAQGGKAYLEWAEISGTTTTPVHIQNILRLDNFGALWKQCKASFRSAE